MPGGPAALGLVYFAAVKFAGYSYAAHWLRRRYEGATANPYLAGGVRTAIGLAAGIGLMFAMDRWDVDVPSWGFYAALVPVRIAEWMLLLWLFFERGRWSTSRALTYSILGYAWSTLLDLPALLSVFILPGGVWVC